MALIDNLISYWKLDETSGTRADAHGSNTLADNNTVTYDTGKISNAAAFVIANSEFLSIADASQTGLEPANVSISAWIKVTDVTTDQYIVSKSSTISWASPYLSYALKIDTSKILGYVNANAGTASAALSNATWYHLVYTYDGTNMRVYVNAGTPTVNALSAINYNDGPFIIGGRVAGQTFGGLIDEVGIWNRVLTAAEVTELYNSGAGLAYPFAAAGPANLKSYNTNLKANIKTINTNPIANIKTFDTNV